MNNNYRGTYLIQSLNKPRNAKGPFAVNPFAFGGGGSGLNKEAAEQLEDIWSPEYMGAAEYEFGIFAKTLKQIYEFRKADQLIATVVPIDGKTAEKSGSWYSKGQAKAPTSVFVICRKDHFEDVVRTIDSLINDTKIPQGYGQDAAVRLKTGIRLWDALYSPSMYWDPCAWHAFGGGLELDNGWFVFTDLEMFRKTCALYDLNVPEDQIATAKRYVPPKAMFSNETVDQKILRSFDIAFPEHDFISLCYRVYDISGKVGEVLTPDQIPLTEQVEKRIKYLVRTKKLIRDRKTKRVTLATKETP
jgi:hypothetical protein